MVEIGITRRQAADLKKKIIERDGGICSENSEQLLAIDKMVTEEGEPINVMHEINEKNKAKFASSPKVVEKYVAVEPAIIPEEVEVPLNVVTVPQTVQEHQISWNEDQISLIKAKVAPNATNTEFELMMYMARKYNLDPLLRQIWLVKFGDSPAQIYAGRDGYLEIAHRSGHFDGMKSWVEYEEDEKGVRRPLKGKCVVYRNDMTHPFESEVLFKEYTTGKNLWASKPSIMLIKVAESVCLRKAFRVSGLYDPDEMG
jgi:phage recombination protein Bet